MLLVDPVRLHHLFQESYLVVRVEDGERARQADEFRVPAQHAGAERVERAEPEAFRRPAQDGADALAHLARRLVRERDRQDLPGESAAGHQDVGEARRQHSRFASARTREHEQRAVERLHRLALFRVEASEIVDHRPDIGGRPSQA